MSNFCEAYYDAFLRCRFLLLARKVLVPALKTEQARAKLTAYLDMLGVPQK